VIDLPPSCLFYVPFFEICSSSDGGGGGGGGVALSQLFVVGKNYICTIKMKFSQPNRHLRLGFLITAFCVFN
jgi:hypothetical protein